MDGEFDEYGVVLVSDLGLSLRFRPFSDRGMLNVGPGVANDVVGRHEGVEAYERASDEADIRRPVSHLNQ